MKLLYLLFTLMPVWSFAQTDSTSQVTFSGYADVYYGYDFNTPPTHERPGFLYNHNRHNEFNVNLALLKAAYASDRVRGNLAIMAGTYTQYNLAAEQDLLKHVFEANAGVRLAPELWLDAGIFASHIGLESAISKDNYTLTRSLAAENTPYYESGAKLTYEAGSKWVITGLVLNGWQNIREPEGNSNKAIGTQVQFKPNANILLNSSTFIGNEKPDSVRQQRYFHDFYATFQLSEQLKLAAIFDMGAEKRAASSRDNQTSDKYNTWFNPTLLLHYNFTDKVGLGARAEYYHDPNGVIIASGTENGFKTYGYSLNLDYAPVPNVLLRLEGRLLDSKDAIFTRANRAVDQSAAITSSIAISF
ncbi:porin [Adhaeribacter swui]|uniref:Porin n=1 Tax=Adhaeribacter swui TaxID=2086471 RepID=A0A7G7G9G1_9BACT|nr:porin [Adhaeribacter swui]QNF33795.1 porin [Adhaeribacter swui]